jgi:hypothetical protein
MRSARWTTKATGNTQWEYVTRTPIVFPRPQWLPNEPQYYVHTSCSSWDRRSRLVSSRSPQTSDIEPGSVHAGFVMNKVARGHNFLLVSRLSPVRIIPSMFHLIFIFAVTLNKSSNGEPCKPCNASDRALSETWKKNNYVASYSRGYSRLLLRNDIERDEINVN